MSYGVIVMYEVKTKLKGEQLIHFYQDAIQEVLIKKGMSKIKAENAANEIAAAVAAKMEGKSFNPREELLFENVERVEIKNRLTKKQRQELLQLELLAVCIESFSKEFDKAKMINKENARRLKTARTYVEKVISEIKGMLDEDDSRKYNKWANRMIPAILDPETKVDRDIMDKINKYGDKYVMTQEEFLNIAENAIEISCRGCTNENYKDCRFYKTMFEIGVDPINFGEGCPYRMEA